MFTGGMWVILLGDRGCSTVQAAVTEGFPGYRTFSVKFRTTRQTEMIDLLQKKCLCM